MIIPFAYPVLIIPVLLVAVGLGYLFWKKYTKKVLSDHFHLFERNWKERKETKIVRKWAVLCMILFLALAGLRPQWGMKETVLRYEGLDVLFAMDVSKSMHALDFSIKNRTIDRLSVAKKLISSFVETRPMDRFGLVEFAGESFISSPLTFDREIFLNFLNSASSKDVAIQGTNLSEAVGVSLERLTIKKEAEQRGKVLVVITDGDETADSSLERVAYMAKKEQIPIYTIGIGSLEGVRIPEGSDPFGRTIYKKYKGKAVFTKLSEAPLKKLAEISDGKYFRAESFSDLQKLSSDFNALPTSIMERLNHTDREEQYQFFVLLALLSFVVYVFYPLGRIVIFKKK